MHLGKVLQQLKGRKGILLDIGQFLSSLSALPQKILRDYN